MRNCASEVRANARPGMTKVASQRVTTTVVPTETRW